VEETAGFNPIASLAPLTAAGMQRIAGGTTNPRDAHILVAVTSCCDNFNLTSRLLRNLAVLPDPIHVVVVDDASVDASADRIGELGIEVIENVPEAIAQGLTHSWNVAYRLFQANPQYTSAWIVNNDILVAPNSFTRLDSAAAQTDEPRIVSPMTDSLGLGHNPRCSYQNVEEVYFEGANGTAELAMPDSLLDDLPASLGDANQWMVNNSLVSVDDVDPEYVLGYFIGFPRGISEFESQPGHILPPTLLNTGQEDYWFLGKGAPKGSKRIKPAVARRVFVFHDKAATMQETGHDHKEPDMTWKEWNKMRDDPTFFHQKDLAAMKGVAFAGGTSISAGTSSIVDQSQGSDIAAEAAAREELEDESEEQLASDSARARAAAAVDAEVAKAATSPASGSPSAADLLAGASGGVTDDDVESSANGDTGTPEDEASKMLRAAATGGAAVAGVGTAAGMPVAGAGDVPPDLARVRAAADEDAVEIRTQLSAAAAEAQKVIAEAEHVAATSTDPAERAQALSIVKDAREAMADATRSPDALADSAEAQAQDARGDLASRLEAQVGDAMTRATAALSDAQTAEQTNEAHLAEAEKERADAQEEIATMKQMLADTEVTQAKNAAQLSDARMAILDEERKAEQEMDAAGSASAARQSRVEDGRAVVSQGLADVENVKIGADEAGAHAGGIHSLSEEEDAKMREEEAANAEVDREADEAVAAAEALEGSAPAKVRVSTGSDAAGSDTTSLAALLRSLDVTGESGEGDAEAETLAAKLSRPGASDSSAAVDEDLQVIVDAASEGGADDAGAGLTGPSRPPGAPAPPPEPNHSPKPMTEEERQHAEDQFLGLTKQMHSEMEQSHSQVASAQSSLEKSIGEVQSMMASMDHSAKQAETAKAQADTAPLVPLVAASAADTVKEAEEELATEPKDADVAAAVAAAQEPGESPDSSADGDLAAAESSADGDLAAADSGSREEAKNDAQTEVDAAISGTGNSQPLTAEELIKEAEEDVGDADIDATAQAPITADSASADAASADAGGAGTDSELKAAETMLNDIMAGA
jgi:hypothetical protein